MILRRSSSAQRTTKADHDLEATQFADAVRPLMPAAGLLAARLTASDTVEDVIQEALIRAWRHRATYDSRRGTFRVAAGNRR